MFKFVSGLVCRTRQLLWKKIADARKATEKVVRAQASQDISYRALNDQQNGTNKKLDAANLTLGD